MTEEKKLEKIIVKNVLFGNQMFHNILNEIANSKLKAVTAFKINKLMKLVHECAEDYEKTRIKLIKDFGEEQKDGEVAVTKDSENRDKFYEEMNELGSLDIELEMEKLKFPDSIELTPVQIGYIVDLFVFE